MKAGAREQVACVVTGSQGGADRAELLAQLRRETGPQTDILLFDADGTLRDAGEGGGPPLARDGNRAAPVNPVAALACLVERYPGRDILLLTDTVRLPEGVARRLRHVACADSRTACASPMTGARGIFHVLPEGSEVPLPDPGVVDRLVGNLGDLAACEVPYFLPECAYLRGDALEGLALAELVDLDAAASVKALGELLRSCGWNCMLCDHAYVGLEAGITGDGRAGPDEASFAAAHPLTRLREAVADRLRRGVIYRSAPGIEDKPVQLHIMHSFGGGLGKWVEDFSRADGERINLVLKSIGTWGAFGERLALYSHVDDAEPLRVWDFALPVRSTDISNLHYRLALREIVDRYGVQAILVSSFIGHTLDALELGLPVTVICHDFYPVCPSVTLYFDGVCNECTNVRLERCLAGNPLNYLFRDKAAPAWLRLRRKLVEAIHRAGAKLVTPSSSVAGHLVALEPGLQSAQFHVIAHGVDYLERAATPWTSGGNARLKVLVYGRMAGHKGALLLRPALDRLTELADLFMVGCGDEEDFFLGHPGVTVVERYDLDDLPRILGEIQPDCGLLLSVWPETFSYTLSELQTLGIPPLATRVGSFADRIEDGTTGILFDADVESLLATVRRVADDRQVLSEIRANLARLPRRTGREMVGDYHALVPLGTMDIGERKVRDPYAVQMATRSFATEDAPEDAVQPEPAFADRVEQARSYLSEKIRTSPRLRDWQRGMLAVCVNAACRVIRFAAKRA